MNLEKSDEKFTSTFDYAQTPDWFTNYGVTEKKSTAARLFDDVDTAILAGLVLPLALFGLFANGVTIFVIHKSQNLKSVFNYFIMSLALSDMTSAVISPLSVYMRTWGFDRWNIPSFLCKVCWAGSTGTSVLTSLHITVFAALRFAALKWPLNFEVIRSSMPRYKQ